MSTNLQPATIIPEFEEPKGRVATPTVSPNATRWIWQPMKDITLEGPLGLAKLFGKDDKFYKTIERGKVYPLSDIWLMVTTPPDSNSGNTLNLESGASNQLRMERTVHTAYDCAEDFKLTYQDLCGGVIFDSLTGMDRNQASPLISIVLPTIFNQLDRRGGDKSGTWLGDLTIGAVDRIKASKLNDLDKARAEKLRNEALMGVNIAIRVAQDSRTSLIKSMAQASIGRNGQSQAGPFDEAMAELLGLPVPTTIASEPAPDGQPQAAPSDRMLEFVLQTQERQTQYEEDMALMREEIAALRKEREQKAAPAAPRAAGGRSAPKNNAQQAIPDVDDPEGDIA